MTPSSSSHITRISSFIAVVPEVNDPADPTAEDPAADAGPQGTGCAKSVGKGYSEIPLNADEYMFGGSVEVAKALPTLANHGGKICSGIGDGPSADAVPESTDPCEVMKACETCGYPDGSVPTKGGIVDGCPDGPV